MNESRMATMFGGRVLAIALAAGLGIAIADGCTQVRQAEHSIGIGGGVPKDSVKLATGTSHQGISTTATKSGTVFINDEDTAEVVYTGKVSQGDAIIVDGNSNTITVGSFKKDVKLSNKDTYAAYIH